MIERIEVLWKWALFQAKRAMPSLMDPDRARRRSLRKRKERVARALSRIR